MFHDYLIDNRTSGGFTLLEILIVLAILLFGLAVVSQLMSGSLRQADDTEERTEIQLVCQNRLNEIASGALVVSPGVPETIPSFPHWIMRTFLSETPLPNVSACTVIAQKYETTQSIPIEGKQIILKQWMTRDSIQIAANTIPLADDPNPFSFQADPQGDHDLFQDAGFTNQSSQQDNVSPQETPETTNRRPDESTDSEETEVSP